LAKYQKSTTKITKHTKKNDREERQEEWMLIMVDLSSLFPALLVLPG